LRILILSAIAATVSWIAWKRSADLSMCWLFWIAVLLLLFAVKRRDAAILLLKIGTISNAIVTLLNNGIMPVVGMPASMHAADPIWRMAAAQNRLLLLADHASLWWFSIGDLCLLAGMLIFAGKLIQSKGGPMFLKRFWKEEAGQDVAEYAVMLAVILIIVIGTVKLIGSNSNAVFGNVASQLGQTQ